MERLSAHNPLLPIDAFVPDAEARQWADGRLYLYGSWDVAGRNDYCSHRYHVFSSADMVRWTDHGVAFRSAGPQSDVSWSSSNLYAPDAIYKEGWYHLFFCLSDGSQGVACSRNPQGPFTDAVRIDAMAGIDPGVFVDDDGQAYVYWGQFDAVRAARLQPDMRGIDESTITQPLSVAEHNFHEGSSLRKRNGTYYYVYADTGRHGERPTCLGYATADTPLGPFTYRGVLLDNFGCDPAVWNNHGSIAEVNGQWYVFYHRSSRGTIFNRRVCAEPIVFTADGLIPEVEMTSQGVGGPLDARRPLDAGIACLLGGQVRIDACPLGGEMLDQMQSGDWAAYKYLDFGTGVTSFTATVGGTGAGSLQVRLDSADGPLAGACALAADGQAYRQVCCAVEGAAGIRALYLRYQGEGSVQVAGFRFG